MIYFLIRTQNDVFVAVAAPVDTLLSHVTEVLQSMYTQPRLHCWLTVEQFHGAEDHFVIAPQVL